MMNLLSIMYILLSLIFLVFLSINIELININPEIIIILAFVVLLTIMLIELKKPINLVIGDIQTRDFITYEKACINATAIAKITINKLFKTSKNNITADAVSLYGSAVKNINKIVMLLKTSIIVLSYFRPAYKSKIYVSKKTPTILKKYKKNKKIKNKKINNHKNDIL